MKLYVIVFSVRRTRQFGAILNRYKMNVTSFFGTQEHLQMIWSELVGRAALTSKLESYHPLHFITKGSYTVAFPQYRHWRMLGGLLKKCVNNKQLIYSFQPITLQGFILFYLNVMCNSSHLIRLQGSIEKGNEN